MKFLLIIYYHDTIRLHAFFYKHHFYKQRRTEIAKKSSNTLRQNFGYLKIIHFLHSRYHAKIIRHTLKISKRLSVSVFMRLYD